MARRWTIFEEHMHREELQQLYVKENKTISEISRILGLVDASVYDRLIRLGIRTNRAGKTKFNNQRSDVYFPEPTPSFAEFLGIMLGDGHVSHFQTMVTLGTKELQYARYVRKLMQNLFGGTPRIAKSARGDRTVYLGSTMVVKRLKEGGLVQNKVAAQVDVPTWIVEKPEYMKAFVRGFFDTDGSIYKLKFGVQISLTNRSAPLLASLQKMLKNLQYYPSAVSADRVYLTRRSDVERFFQEIRPANLKHQRRFAEVMRRWRSSKRT